MHLSLEGKNVQPHLNSYWLVWTHLDSPLSVFRSRRIRQNASHHLSVRVPPLYTSVTASLMQLSAHPVKAPAPICFRPSLPMVPRQEVLPQSPTCILCRRTIQDWHSLYAHCICKNIKPRSSIPGLQFVLQCWFFGLPLEAKLLRGPTSSTSQGS